MDPKRNSNQEKESNDVNVVKMFPRVKRSVLIDLINAAREKYPNVEERVQQWQVEDVLGEFYINSTNEQRDEMILEFAAKNELMITEPLPAEECLV